MVPQRVSSVQLSITFVVDQQASPFRSLLFEIGSLHCWIVVVVVGPEDPIIDVEGLALKPV